MVGVLMSVGVMTVGVMTVGVMSVGEITVGVMTVGVMTVGVMRRPRISKTSCKGMFFILQIGRYKLPPLTPVTF